MMKEIKRKWEPIANLTHNYGVEYLLDNKNGLEILLFDRWTEDILKVTFEGHLLYRNINDSYYLNGPDFLPDNEESEEPWEFYIIENSEFKKWFKMQDAANLCDPKEIIHYAIYTTDDCIDVLSWRDTLPKLEYVVNTTDTKILS